MPEPAFTVVPYSTDALFQACASGHFTAERMGTQRRAAYLARYLEHQKCATLVVEYGYTDGDYLDDFANYYVRSFRDYSRRCKRLHFFAEAFDEATLRERLLAGDGTALQESYLGFAVIRPLPNAIFGRTVLATYPATELRHYPSVRSYSANLFGTELRLDSLAFQEQDTVIAACATVALWSAFQKTAILFDSRMPTPAEITRTATSSNFYSRPLPSRGLTLAQMALAVKEVGLEPEVIECTPRVPLLSLIYGYLNYGVPVVLGIDVEGSGHHAVTVTGYSLTPSVHLPYEHDADPSESELNRVGRRMDQLFLHDDGWGPFVKVSTHVDPPPADPDPASDNADAPLDDEGSRVYFEGTWPGHKKKFARLSPKWAMVPAYHKIRLTFLDIQRWIMLMNIAARHTLADMSNTEWETLLVDNNSLKEAARGWGLPRPALEALLFNPLPRYLWKATLTVDQVPVMDLIFDATGIARSFSVLTAVFRNEAFRAALAQVLQSPATRKVLGTEYVELLLKSAA